jgi:hypothetical protein
MDDDIVFNNILDFVCNNYDKVMQNDKIDIIYKNPNYLNHKINSIFCSEKDKKIIMMTYMLYLYKLTISS